MWTEITQHSIGARTSLRKRYEGRGMALACAFDAAAVSGGAAARGRSARVVNAILYILATGCQWRALPKDFPPRSTVQDYFYGWRNGASGSGSTRYS